MRGARSLSVLLLVAFLLGICAGRDVLATAAGAESSGDWQITKEIDSVTGAKILNMKIEARKTAHDGLFLPPDALLQLGCLKNHPLIHISFALQIGSKADSEILYRFDDKPAQPVEARILRGLRIFVIEDKTQVKQFFDGLGTANVLYIMIDSLDKGKTSVEFRVAGAQTPIDLLSGNCPAKKK